MIAVTFALPSESAAFLALLQQPTCGAHSICGTLDGQRVCVLHTGVGEKTTRLRLPDFLRAQSPRLLLSAGFAGALHDRWQVGDLFVAENYTTAQIALPELAPSHSGRLVTAASVIDSSAERAELRRTGAADAVDMETAFIAEICAAMRIPMVSLRAITDTPSHPFPAPPEVLFDLTRQRTVILPLCGYLLLHPSAIMRLLFFARRVATTRRTLAHALAAIIREAV
ncbi:MAG: hypothetical protein ABI992_01210 [Chthoniobacterales bacterium]